jgi:hypothetical protein
VRQIYTSPRVENVERVVALLAEAGIQTSVTNRRAYAGHDYKGPSYSARPDPGSWPQVWVVNAEDQPRARALLREIGVEPAIRFADELQRARAAPNAEDRRSALGWKIRIALLGVIALLITLHLLNVL